MKKGWLRDFSILALVLATMLLSAFGSKSDFVGATYESLYLPNDTTEPDTGDLPYPITDKNGGLYLQLQ